MTTHRVEKRYENRTTRESIVVEGTLNHPEPNIEEIRRLIISGEITPDHVEWDAKAPPPVPGSFNVIIYS